MPEVPAINDFLRRRKASGTAERANCQLFLSELCDLLSVPCPDPTVSDDRDVSSPRDQHMVKSSDM